MTTAREAPAKVPPPLHARSAREIKSTLDAKRAMLPFLVWRDGEGTQLIFTLDTRRRLTVGRRASNDIVLGHDAEVSRTHAELEPIAEDDWTVCDSGLSRNGTFVGDDRVAGRRRLTDGDMLRFGKTAVEYRRPTEGLTASTALDSSLPGVGDLTKTQRAILVALARPYRSGASFLTPASNAEVAREVCLGLDAVKGHLGVLYQRFEIAHLARGQKRARLVECAFRYGLVSERDLEQSAPRVQPRSGARL
jgi:hypothetical protein